jgi:hypothetical protein
MGILGAALVIPVAPRVLAHVRIAVEVAASSLAVLPRHVLEIILAVQSSSPDVHLCGIRDSSVVHIPEALVLILLVAIDTHLIRELAVDNSVAHASVLVLLEETALELARSSVQRHAVLILAHTCVLEPEVQALGILLVVILELLVALRSHTGQVPEEVHGLEQLVALRNHTGEILGEVSVLVLVLVLVLELLALPSHTGEIPVEVSELVLALVFVLKLLALHSHTGEIPGKVSVHVLVIVVLLELLVALLSHSGEIPSEASVLVLVLKIVLELLVTLRSHTGEIPSRVSVLVLVLVLVLELLVTLRSHTGEIPGEVLLVMVLVLLLELLALHSHTGEIPGEVLLVMVLVLLLELLALHSHTGEILGKFTGLVIVVMLEVLVALLSHSQTLHISPAHGVSSHVHSLPCILHIWRLNHSVGPMGSALHIASVSATWQGIKHAVRQGADVMSASRDFKLRTMRDIVQLGVQINHGSPRHLGVIVCVVVITQVRPTIMQTLLVRLVCRLITHSMPNCNAQHLQV